MTLNADFILKNAILLTMDVNLSIFEPGALAIQGDQILAVGNEADICQQYSSEQTIDCQGKVLMPGLINAHTHAAMTLLRGLADDLRLDVWLMGYMMPVERQFVSSDFVRLGTKLACAEMIRSGVTCFADMYYFEDDAAQATADAGLRAVCAQTVLKFPGPDARDYEEALENTRIFLEKWHGHPLILPAVGPHSPYTCTQEILRSAASLAKEFDVPLLIHLSETRQEVENSRKEHGMPVIPYVKKQDLFEAKVLAAHCVHVDDGEIKTLLHHKAGVAHNPSSNLKLASGFAPISNMLATGLNVGIGTDGPASNNDLDMFEEIRLAALLSKGISGDPTNLPASTALTMATRMGAEAIQLGAITGSLEPGKRADLILVDNSRVHNSPRFKREQEAIYAQLVYSTQATDVTDVMVNGKWLMRDYQLLTLNETVLLADAAEYAHRIDAFLLEREHSVLSKLIAIGGASEEESYEVQVKVTLTDPQIVISGVTQPGIEVLHHRHYHEYDTYFSFMDASQGYLRYREDEAIGPNDQISNVRYRLTLLGPTREGNFPSDVLLSRSRFIAPANHSLRFYREYFKPSQETVIEKHRLRWRILYHGLEFYVNLDRMDNPALGHFVEVKSRTWSRKDAEHKALVAWELIRSLGITNNVSVSQDYIEIVNPSNSI
ncbi:MAG: amidohydrolase family protein [Anaerolineales bacterium]|jgi:5-methylthioadenosine/S-adenosylhomocysteine deaminase